MQSLFSGFLPDELRDILSYAIPFSGTLLKVGERGARRFFLAHRDLDTARLDASDVHPRHDQIASTHRIEISDIDPKRLRRKVGAFCKQQLNLVKYLDPDAFTMQLAQKAELVYPELVQLRYYPALSTNSVRHPDAWRLFGEGNRESDKAISKLVLTFALLANRADYFSGLGASEFARFRANFIEDLELNLAAEESKGFASLDSFLSFLMSESIGRSFSQLKGKLPRNTVLTDNLPTIRLLA